MATKFHTIRLDEKRSRKFEEFLAFAKENPVFEKTVI